MNFRKFWPVLASCVILILAQSLSAQANNELRVGQVIGNEQGQIVNGWKQVGGTHFPRRTTQNYVTTEVDECCVVVFKKGAVYLLAATTPIARNLSGGVEAEKINLIRKVIVATGEREADCNLMWIYPVVSFFSNAKKPIRSIIFDGSNFVEIKWFGSKSYCDLGD